MRQQDAPARRNQSEYGGFQVKTILPGQHHKYYHIEDIANILDDAARHIKFGYCLADTVVCNYGTQHIWDQQQKEDAHTTGDDRCLSCQLSLEFLFFLDSDDASLGLLILNSELLATSVQRTAIATVMPLA